MVATVVFNGTNITEAANADVASFSVVKVSGAGGTPSPVAENDVTIQGSDATSNAVSVKVSKQRIILWYDIGAGNELDFTAGTGAERDQYIFIWSVFVATGLLLTAESVAAGGFGIALGSSTANYSLWNRGGNDKNLPSDWKRYAIDPTTTATTSAGSGLDVASVRYFGMFADVGGTTARFENLVIDRIDYGYGLRIYGPSTTDDLLGDIFTADAGTLNNKYGFIRKDNGIFFVHGEWLLGDDVGTNSSTLTDKGKVVVFESQEYWIDATSNWVTAIPSTYNKFNRVGNSTNGTALTLGDGFTLKTGEGVDGLKVQLRVELDDAHTGAGADLTLNGVRFDEINQLFTLSVNGSHTIDNTTFNNCIKITNAGDGSDGIVIRDSSFQNYEGEEASLLWGDGANGYLGMDVQDCEFKDNVGGTNSSGIEVTGTGTSYTFTNITRPSASSNDFDVYNSSATNKTINLNGTSNFTTKRENTGTITYVNTKSINITVKDASTEALIQNARIHIEANTGGDLPSKATVTSITRSGSVATVTMAAVHNMQTNEWIIIRKANQQEYNGIFQITVTSTTEFTYTVTGTPISPATGTITGSARIMSELSDVNGFATENHRFTNNQDVIGYIRKGTVSPLYKPSPISGTIDTNGFTTTISMTSDE